jgi:hypothetical protein
MITRKNEEEESNPSARAQKNTTNLSLLTKALCGIGEDLITWVYLELNARALVSSWKVENLDDLNVGWLGVFIAPTTKLAVWWRLSVAWCTGQSGAHRTCPVRQPRH